MKRRVLLLLISILMFVNPLQAAENADGNPVLPNIFIWQIPDTDVNNAEEIYAVAEEHSDEEITLQIKPEEIYVKGYAEYEESADAIYLTDEHNNFVLNLRVPQKLESKKLADSKKVKNNNFFSRYNSEEYSIAPQSVMAVEKHGGFSYGTLFNSGIDNAQLERSTTLFTRYEAKNFALSSAYKKNNLTTYGLNTDNFYISPELRLNKMFSVSEVLSADVTRNRRKGELVLTVNPTKSDNMLFELGAGTTYDIDNDRSWSQVRFSTKFKL